ncbi:hypothetical protein J6I75_04730 [Pseudidiomarina sp. 1APP75-27a]|uniref:hypothetical protein n=1 Tax=Pseudidiomarina terrestris TaxID=2820060 RepID=UPI002B061FBA|nr:hypothetical protein [Pseudidiomarina sp. 1APP75-27a]MEA3587649.1 hypothetical protein [Pseudidiomarina sp. 1APP75-27a]
MSSNLNSTTTPCEEVFITQAKLKGIVSKMHWIPNADTIDIPELSIELEIKKLLSQQEIRLLAVYQLLCQTPEDAFMRFQTVDKSRKSNSRMLFIAETSAYHCHSDCSTLHNDYKNFLLPAEVVVRNNPDEIAQIRAFAKKNRALLEKNEEQFIFKLQAAFGLKQGIKKVVAPNSGVAKAENHDLPSVLEAINELLEQAEQYRNQDAETAILISRLGYATHKRVEATNPNNPLYVWHHTYKGQLKVLLQTYFRVKFNPDLKFKGALLEQLGFKPCNHCCSPQF